MIESTIYFEKGTDLAALVEALKALPESVQPVYFAEDEGKIIKTNRLTNKARFQNFLAENAIVFFLYAENRTCIDISIPTEGYVGVTMYLAESLPSELAVALFRCPFDFKPVFGYACEYDEYKHRNRYYITIGQNHIEDWVGRKLDKYISGVYWYTLLSDGILTMHGIKLANLAAEAMTTETLDDGSLYLLKFFEEPEEWQENAERLDDLCERGEGVFSRRTVEAIVARATNFFEYDDIIANWR